MLGMADDLTGPNLPFTGQATNGDTDGGSKGFMNFGNIPPWALAIGAVMLFGGGLGGVLGGTSGGRRYASKSRGRFKRRRRRYGGRRR